jgi:hypothetical protein
LKALVVGKGGREFGDLVLKEVEKRGRKNGSWGLSRKSGRSVTRKESQEWTRVF